ncbi:RHS repeat-associated core domain-containing protein [Kribbella sancticallisti]|uniref:RHS repeat-associated core domain-containing protein n=1 Tax=Kribbella sancticallisti TaxID=460087 RepID=A0ABN2EP52_9ACTN
MSTRFLRRPRARRAGRLAIATATATALIATVWGPAAQAGPLKDDPLWKPKKEKPVPGSNYKPIPKAADPAEAKAVKATPKVAWPAAGAAEVAVPAPAAGWTAMLAGRQAGPRARAGSLPVWVGSAIPASATATAKASDTAPATLRIDLSRRATDGLLLKLTRTDGLKQPGKVSLQLNYNDFRDAFGGDWALRLQLLKMPACALTRPGTPACAGTPVPVQNSGDGTLTGDVTVSSGTELYAVQSSAAGGTGNFGASQLSPTATWQVGGSSGDFTWNYPMNVPPGNGGPAPQIALGYSSGGVDGRTSATNNQPSWAGQGFDLQPGGSIEQRFASCGSKTESSGNNGTRATGDLCWAGENAVFSLNGKGGELVRDDATGTWRPRNDDGSKVEKLSGADNGDDGRIDQQQGEHWRLTTKDGTKYYFGLNKLPGATTQRTNSSWTVPVFGNHSGEQCFAAGNFAGSWCQQTYKWNLDYVVDRHGNTMSLYYDTEKNYYARNQTATAVTPYTRAGHIRTIEYGQRENALYTTPPVGKVQFSTTERCLDGSACTADADYPDVPLDRRCIGANGAAPANCDNRFNPAFYTTKKLSKVTTEIARDTTFSPVSSWSLRYAFPDNGDGTKPALWLDAITHAGHVGNAGGVAIPEVNFDGIQLANRVDKVGDNLPEMNWWRINRVSYGTGGELAVGYYPMDCKPGDTPAPDTNGRRCHPMKWTPPGSTVEQTDWFHKYVVRSVTETDRISGTEPVVTTVAYPNPPAWRHDDEDGLVEIGQKTWSQWRGYDQVEVRKGNTGGPQTLTVNRYYRGMYGDKLAGTTAIKEATIEDSTGVKVNDLLPLAGQPRETSTFNGTQLVTRTITDQWVSAPTSTRTRTWGTTSAYQAQQAGNRQVETLASGGARQSTATNNYDANGVLLSSNDLNDLSTAADDTCTTYEYTKNDTLGILEIPKRELSVAVACGTPHTQQQVISDNRTFYDNATSIDTAPIKGDVTKTERLMGFGSDGKAQYQTVNTTTYDALGRAVEMTDADGQKSTTTYTPTGAGPVTKVESTKPNGHKTSIEFEPAWGEEVAVTDEAGKRTEATYDPLGRTKKVWYPGRTGAAIASAQAGANIAGMAAAADNEATPDVEYDYTLFSNAPMSVNTKTLQTDGGIESTLQLYDGLMRPRQSQQAAQGGGRIVNEVIYDSRGLEVKENGPYYNDAPPVGEVLIPDEEKLPTQKITQYDLAGRPTAELFKSENAPKWQTTHTYNGDSESVDPPTGETPTTKVTDVQGRLLELRQYTGDGPTGGYDSTKYTYTNRGQLESIVDSANNKWSYEYDVRGRKTKETDPDKGITTYSYDELDRMAAKTDARGITLAYAYDSNGRTTGVYEGSLDGHQRAGWIYDTLLPGMPTSSTRYDANDNAYTTSVTGYDDAGRATGTEYVIPANEGALAGTYRFESTYRPDGQTDTETLPEIGGLPAETLTYGYDAKDQPATLKSADTDYVRGTGYTPFGEVERVTLGATEGRWVELGYQYETGTRRLSSVITQRETLPRRISEVQYTYDDSGNIRQINDVPSATSNAPTDTQCFTYDHLRRMTAAWTPAPDADNVPVDCITATPAANRLGGPAPYWHSWTFDKIGNRKTETKTWSGGSTTSTYAYPTIGQARPHAVQSVVTTGTGMPVGGRTDSYTYNETGDRKTRTSGGVGETYVWNADDDLEKVVKGGQETQFLYNANGDRLIRRDNTGTTLYLGDTELLLKAGTTTVDGTRYYKHGEQTVAVRTKGNLHWLGADHHGTSTTTIDNTAQQNVQRRREDPYGNLRGAAPTAWPGQRGFVGGTNDPSTGLVHLGARDYDPTIGKFISVDPQMDMTDPQTLNAYVYGNNNPVTFSDPDGLSWFSSIVTSIKTVTETVTRRVVDTVKEAVRVVTPVISWVKDRVTATMEAVKTFVAKTVEVVKQVVKTVKTVVKKAVKTVQKITKKVAQVAKKAVAKVKQVAKTVVKTAKAVAHKVAAVAQKAANWVYEHRAQILAVVAEIALTVAIGALTGGVGALAVRGAIMAARYAASSARMAATVKRFEVGYKGVHMGHQEKHFLGAKGYIPGRSELTADPIKLINNSFGRGRQVGPKPPGVAGHKEKVTFNEQIGTSVGRDGSRTPTNSGVIHYNQKGQAHIVPALPE